MIISDSKDFISKFTQSFQKKSLEDTHNHIRKLFSFYENIFCGDFKDKFWDKIIYTSISDNSHFDLLYDNADLFDNENVICFAGEGENFHGTKGKKWAANYGNIHLSAIINSVEANENDYIYYNIILIKTVFELLNEILPKQEPKVKWINDVFIEEMKISGIISKSITLENSRQIILGIGINVNNNPNISDYLLSYKTTSISEFDKYVHHHYCEKLLFDLLSKNLTKKFTMEELIDYYNKHLYLKGENCELISERVPIHSINRGKLIGVDDKLQLIFENTPVRFNKGRIRKLRN